MSNTPRFDNWWKSYQSGAVTASEFAEAVRGMERELTAARCALADTNLTVEKLRHDLKIAEDFVSEREVDSNFP